jgi:hypothetical protein
MNTTNANKYKGCEYYPLGVSSGVRFRYATKKIGGFCLPDVGGKALNTTLDAVKAVKEYFYKSAYGEKFANFFNDIFTCWPVLLASTGVALVLGYIYLFVMRCLGGAIVWFMIILTELSLGAIGGYCFYIRATRYTPTD